MGIESISGFSSSSTAVRIAHLLDIEGAGKMTEVGLARAIGSGLPTSALTRLVDAMDRFPAVAALVPEATLRRARTAGKPLSREHSARIYDLSRVFEITLRAYHDDADSAVEFLSRRHMLLDFERPIDLAQLSSAGADAVIAVIRRAQAGGAI
jgi:putative toxin-antitoxin system antitoxin component (TIGR02293 family)